METDKEKLIEMPTMLANTGKKAIENETVYELDSNFSIVKKNDPNESNQVDNDLIKELSNPDNLIIPPTDTHFVDLNFSTINSMEDSIEKDNLPDNTFDLNKICDEKFDLLEITSTSNNSSDNISENIDQSDNKALDTTVLLVDKPVNAQDTGLDINSTNLNDITNQTSQGETIIGSSASPLEVSTDSNASVIDLLKNAQSTKMDEIGAINLNSDLQTDSSHKPDLISNETNAIKLEQNDKIADNLMNDLANKLSEQQFNNELPVQLTDTLPPVIGHELAPEQRTAETENQKNAANLDKPQTEMAEIKEIECPSVESVEKLEPIKLSEQMEQLKLNSSNSSEQPIELLKVENDKLNDTPSQLSDYETVPKALLPDAETISVINPSNDDKTELSADDTATITGVVSGKIAETISAAAAVASTLLGNKDSNEQPQPSLMNVHVGVNQHPQQQQLLTSMQEKGNVDDNAVLPSEPIVEAIETALVTDFLPTSATPILSSSAAKEVEKGTEEKDDKQKEEAKYNDQILAPKTSIINEKKQSDNNKDEDDDDDDENHEQQQPEEQKEEKVVETLEEKFNDREEEQQQSDQANQEPVIENPEQFGTNLSSSSATTVKSVTSSNVESIASTEQINSIPSKINKNESALSTSEKQDLVQPILSSSPPPLSTFSPKSAENPVDSVVIDNKSTTMGKKNYQRQNSSENTSQANLEPDCIQQFVQTLFGQCAADILYWRDPKNTGAVFGVGLVILFSLTIFSVISVVAYTLLFTLLATLSFRVYKNVMQAVNKTEEGHPFKEYLDMDITPNQERAHEIADQLLSHFNCFLSRMRSVLLVEDYVESLKYLFLFWSLTFIGAWFNGMTLVILAYIGVFSLPKVYEMNQAQIDQYIDLAASKINDITEKIPFLKKATSAEKKDN